MGPLMRKRAGKGERLDCRAAEGAQPENDLKTKLIWPPKAKPNGHQTKSPGLVAVRLDSGDGSPAPFSPRAPN